MTDKIYPSEEAEVLVQEAAEETAAPLPETVTVVDIQFRSGNKVYYFDPGQLQLKAGDHVIMDTARGNEFGYCTAGNHEVSGRDIVPPLRKIHLHGVLHVLQGFRRGERPLSGSID